MTTFDVAVIGAGPAGALSAFLASRRGLRTILIEKQNFPRAKVCGSCLNRHVSLVLERHGLSHVMTSSNPVPLRRFRLCAGTKEVIIPLRGGHALSRRVFDLALLNEALAAGTETRHGAKASIGLWNERLGVREISVSNQEGTTQIRAKVVIAAAGLHSSALPPDLRSSVRDLPSSRIGAGAFFPASALDLTPGDISMHLVPGGYIGVTALEDGTLDAAAAFDPGAIPERIDTYLVRLLKASAPPLTKVVGTPPLTRALKRVSAPGVFIAGDAAGYVEPFTGEGIGLALEQASALSALIPEAAIAWHKNLASRWEAMHHAITARSFLRCRILSRLVMMPGTTLLLLKLLHSIPGFDRRVAQSFAHAEAA